MYANVSLQQCIFRERTRAVRAHKLLLERMAVHMLGVLPLNVKLLVAMFTLEHVEFSKTIKTGNIMSRVR